MSRVKILGLEIDNLTMAESLDSVSTLIESRNFGFAVTPNVDHVMKLRRDANLRAIYRQAQFVFADGVPLLWASAILGSPLKERVNGTDLFERLCAVAADRDYSVYFLGGNPGSAAAAARALTQRHPRLHCAGCWCPEPGFEKDPGATKAIQERIAASKADILFVALGAPKQEDWIYRFARQTGVAFAIGIGISFSLVCGEQKRAPKWFQRHGFEWLWRLGIEPGRLWKRYLLEDMPFIGLVGREWARTLLLQKHP